MKGVFSILVVLFFLSSNPSNYLSKINVPQNEMVEIYNTIKTPYKYGVVFRHHDSTKKVDCPTIFRKDNVWYMTYIVFDGQGYETWLAESNNLLEWKSKGKERHSIESTEKKEKETN